jgi:hypothetical protein
MASKPILSAVPATPEERSVDRRICEPDGTAALWEAFWSSVEIGVRNALVRACQPLVRVMVMRLPANVRAYWEKDDLQSFGQLGLMEAIDRWAPDSPLDGLGAYATKDLRVIPR